MEVENIPPPPSVRHERVKKDSVKNKSTRAKEINRGGAKRRPPLFGINIKQCS